MEMTADVDKSAAAEGRERVAAEVDNREAPNRVGRGRHRLDVPDSPLMERVLRWILEHNVEHVHGPREVEYGVDELVVLVLLRNGRPYIKPFIEHYFTLGVKHIVFLDNGSTDGTVEALQNYENVTVLRSQLPFKKYNITLKQYLVERFGRGRWTLNADIDELFEYPYSDVVSLKALLKYLNDNFYTAVVTYMLDMFPETLLSADSSATDYESLKELHRFYDISDVRTLDYSQVGDIGNVVANERIEILQGGVMQRVFGTSPLLTKHPLIFLDDRLTPHDLSDHWVGNARIADFTALFLHYKLSANLYGLVRREIEERRYNNLHGKYDKIHKVLAEAPSLLMRNDTSKELKSVNELVGTRFVSVSKQYMRFVENEAQKNGHYSEESRSERLAEAFFNARAEVAAYGRKTRELQQELKKSRAESRSKRAALNRARNAEMQIEAIQASRSWKTLTVLKRIRMRAGDMLGQLRNGVQR
jgi:glycosyltransferase involved in cell wall biosynthesis